MTPFKLIWDSQKGLLTLNWNRLFSIGREGEKSILKVLGIPIPLPPSPNKVTFPMRWFYIKNGISFIAHWRLERLEGTISFSDPMINGVLYGWLSALEGVKPKKKFGVTINFLGTNNFSGQASIPPRVLFTHLRRWILPLFLEMGRAKRKQREEEKQEEVNDNGCNRIDQDTFRWV